MVLLFLLLVLAIVVALLAIQTGLRAEDRADEAQPPAWRWEPSTASSTGPGPTVTLYPVTASTAGRRP